MRLFCNRKVAGSNPGRAKTFFFILISFISPLIYVPESINCYFSIYVEKSLKSNSFKYKIEKVCKYTRE